MKNLNFILGLGLFAASLTASAQKTIVSVGFEDGDQKYTSSYAYTKGGTYGNWVNKQDADEWNEACTEEVHSGSKSFKMSNNEGFQGNTWDRGFVIDNIKLQDNTAYRVSFWAKAEPSFIFDGNETSTKLKSSLFIGHEYCDMPISTKSGVQYYNNYTDKMNGEWRHFSYVTYFTNKADQDSWSMNYTGKEDINGSIPVPQGDPFPENYGLIINMYNPGDYYLDDIKIEEGVIFNEASFGYDAIRLDFGYPTNAGDLAKANGGFYIFSKDCASVTINGQAAEIHSVEAHSDGYVYVFIETENYFESTDQVTVSFNPGDNNPLVYTSDKRPSADTESEMKVPGITNETAYYVGEELGDVTPADWAAPELVSTTPENDSFDLYDSEIQTVSFNFNMELSDAEVSAYLSWSDNYGSYNQDLDNIKLSDDKMSYVITLPQIADGDYKVVLSGAANSKNVPCEKEFEMSFSKGEAAGDAEPSKDIFVTDFDNEMKGGVPCGWNTYNEAGYHLYGFNDEARTSQYNYDWGGIPGGGGTRLYEGFSGDFKKAMYWGTRGTTEGYATYGELVKDYINADGSLAADCPEGLALYLDPRKYQITFLMAAWKGEPTFTFTLEDLKGNVYAKFVDIKAAPNMNGKQTKVTGSVKCQTDFTVDKEGYYVLKFTSCEAVWQEFLLANVKLITMPSKSAYYKNMLAAAAQKGQEALDAASGTEYNGDTKSSLAADVRSAQSDRFTQGSAVEELCTEIEDLIYKLEARVSNIDQYDINLIEAQTAIESLVETNADYAKSELYINAVNSYKEYENVSASSLDDEALAAAVSALADIASKVNAIPSTIGILTWGASQAVQLATSFGVSTNGAENLLEDNRTVIDGANQNSKAAILGLLAQGDKLDNYMTSVYNTAITSDEWEDGDPNFDENGHPLMFKGVNLSAFIMNAHLYRTYGDDGVPGWTIDLGGNETGEETLNIGYSATPSATNPIVDAQINIYGKTNYDFSQVIKNLPAGYYNVVLQTRTPKKFGNGVITDEEIYYNAQDENGTWDKYIYAKGDGDAEQKVAPFIGADGLSTTVIENVKVVDGQLTMGAHEYYVSGVARTWEPASDAETDATDGWLGTTYVDYANIYFMAPIEGYDYKTAAATSVVDVKDAATVKSIFNVSGTQANKLQKGINIVKMSDGSVRKVLVK